MNRQNLAWIGAAAAVLALDTLAGGASARAENAKMSALSAEKPFLQENAAAMDRMMAGMSAAPTGDIDRDFATGMTSHHQGAIDMAQAYLRHGHNEQLRRIAQEIVVEQQQEIAAMALATGAALPPSAPAATTATPAHIHHSSTKATR